MEQDHQELHIPCEENITQVAVQANAAVIEVENDGHKPRPKERVCVRKRKRDQSNWKAVQRKKMKDSGQSYISTSGKIVAQKTIEPCNCKCTNK